MVWSHPRSRPFPAFRRILLSCLALLPLAGGVQAQGTSTAQNPTVSFSTPGSKQVTLQACNASGCTTVTRTVVVLDPKPSIVNANIPLQVGIGQPVTLQDSVTGRPPLTHKWVFSAGGVDTTVTGSPATWNAPATPGTYLAHLEVSNSSGSASSLPVTVSVVPSAYADVPPDYWAWKFIENLHTRGVATSCGTSPLRYCPDAPMTRGEMAIFLLRAKDGAAYVPPACVTPAFNDVPCSDPLAPWVNELVRRGVTAGCGGGNYCPGNAVSRDQMAVFLIVTKRGAGYVPDQTCLSAAFNDIPCYNPFSPWVKELVALGVTAGCGGGGYCPLTPVSRAQMAIFISVMFNLPPP
jgi:hypothetical protein